VSTVRLMPDAHLAIEADSDEALARRIAGGPPGSTDAEESELYRRFAPRVRLYGCNSIPRGPLLSTCSGAFPDGGH